MLLFTPNYLISKFMRVLILLIFFMVSLSVNGQEIGSVQRGKHSVKILKNNDLFSFVYSDVNSNSQNTLNSFLFIDKSSLYSLLMDGFESENDHQMIVQMIQDTIVKFEFKNINGRQLLKIKQNNLSTQTFGTSIFFTKDEILQLFGKV